jgi:hypothetical protein
MAKAKYITFWLSDQGWIVSVEDFLESFFKLRKTINDEKLWFRGLSWAKHPLLPSIGRVQEYGGRLKTFNHEDEVVLLRRFRRRAYPHEKGVSNIWEALFLARHYGLPTRLLDWTANALYGLYFACVGQPHEDGALWAITRVRGNKGLDVFPLLYKTDEKSLFKMYKRDRGKVGKGEITKEAVKIIDPIYNSPRIVAQDGAFTLHSNPWRSLESYVGVRFQKSNLDVSGLYRWKIHAIDKPNVIAQLSGLGITHRIMFPDLDGIARSLWETEVLWRGKILKLRGR